MHPLFDVVLFDFDGTVCETGTGVMRSAAYALQRMGLPVPGEETLRSFIGPPLGDNFQLVAGLNAGQAEQAIAFFRERYAEKGMYELNFYEGIVPLVRTLRAAGVKTAVASSKAEYFLHKILAHLGEEALFDAVTGAELDGRRSQKDEVIACAFSRCGCGADTRVVLVGDTKYDAAGARKMGIPFIGVLWGYGTEAEMRAEGAERFVRTPEELQGLIMKTMQ